MALCVCWQVCASEADWSVYRGDGEVDARLVDLWPLGETREGGVRWMSGRSTVSDPAPGAPPPRPGVPLRLVAPGLHVEPFVAQAPQVRLDEVLALLLVVLREARVEARAARGLARQLVDARRADHVDHARVMYSGGEARRR